ncbi:unnamed protein product [Ixodes persulcatus]
MDCLCNILPGEKNIYRHICMYICMYIIKVYLKSWSHRRQRGSAMFTSLGKGGVRNVLCSTLRLVHSRTPILKASIKLGGSLLFYSFLKLIQFYTSDFVPKMSKDAIIGQYKFVAILISFKALFVVLVLFLYSSCF